VCSADSSYANTVAITAVPGALQALVNVIDSRLSFDAQKHAAAALCSLACNGT
jgi:hypothetical protein